MSKRTLNDIRKSAIDKSFIAIIEIEKVLTQEIELEELDPEKAKAAVLGKKEAQSAIFDMVARIQQEQSELDLENKAVTKEQQAINKSSKGFAESQSRDDI